MSKDIDVNALIDNMAEELDSYSKQHGYDNPLMIGIKRGGAWIAKELHKRLEYAEPPGQLNIAFYRDDFSTLGMHPEVSPSELPINIEGRDIILVDDVLYTGRTIRAAMNEIFDYGRPESITLLVLIDRNGREIPIQADIIGKTIDLNEKEHVKLSGPASLALEIKQTG